MLIHDGPVETVIAECESYLRTAGRLGGYCLADGIGLMPGTPPEHIEAMVEASKQVGAVAGTGG
jgi:uroporphyrinogen-III decarboxylase